MKMNLKFLCIISLGLATYAPFTHANCTKDEEIHAAIVSILNENLEITRTTLPTILERVRDEILHIIGHDPKYAELKKNLDKLNHTLITKNVVAAYFQISNILNSLPHQSAKTIKERLSQGF